MAEFQPLFQRSACLLSLRTSAAPWLEELAVGLSQLQVCRQLRTAQPHGSLLWMRLGPDEWWCWWQDEALDTQTRMRSIARAAGGCHHACVDISDAQVAFVSSAPAAPVLSFGCDLDFEQLPDDFAGRTRLAAFSVVLARQPGPEGAMIAWTEASLAMSLQRWFERIGSLANR